MLRSRKLNPCLSIGGITIQINGSELTTVPGALRPYQVDCRPAEVACRGRVAQLPDLSRDRVLFDSGGTWRVDERPADRIALVVRTGGAAGTPVAMLDLDADLGRGQVTLSEQSIRYDPEPFCLQAPLYELWTCFLLLRGRGALFHSCAVLRDGAVFLFPGVSGAGKSTLARIAATHQLGHVLSDDRLILRPEQDGFRVYGTPWHGEARFASAESGLLRGVYFPIKASASEIRPLQPDEAAGRLMQNVFMAGWPRSGLEHLIDFCAKIAKRVPCYELRFLPDRSAFQAVGW